ncbi:MarR family winged helix-turn-helix transcriptional regulator [Nocardia sp. NPDC050712]|uniref:MarR family winged helix-turn-helix transcriptional regulator n=1 Tax=Nocardia sp. NPDC050712 TaxID=3155518 RepID=UPI0033CFB915
MEANKDLVERLSRTIIRFAEATRQGTSRVYDPVRVGVLQHAAESGPIRAGELAERLDALPSSITRHVQVLAESGLVSTAPDPADRRAVLIEVTDAGRAELRQFLETGDQVLAAVIDEWSAEDVATLDRLLNRMLADWATTGPAHQQRATKRRPGKFGWSRT